jgi:hypothetical protein
MFEPQHFMTKRSYIISIGACLMEDESYEAKVNKVLKEIDKMIEHLVFQKIVLTQSIKEELNKDTLKGIMSIYRAHQSLIDKTVDGESTIKSEYDVVECKVIKTIAVQHL